MDDSSLSTENLASDLKFLRENLTRLASDPAHHVDIGRIAGAEIEAKKGNAVGVANTLKGVSKWVLETARQVGVQIVADMIEKSAMDSTSDKGQELTGISTPSTVVQALGAARQLSGADLADGDRQ